MVGFTPNWASCQYRNDSEFGSVTFGYSSRYRFRSGRYSVSEGMRSTIDANSLATNVGRFESRYSASFALPPSRYPLTYSSASFLIDRSTSALLVGFDQSVSFWMRVSASSLSFTSQSPTLQVLRSLTSSSGRVSLSKSSTRGGLLIVLVTRKF